MPDDLPGWAAGAVRQQAWAQYALCHDCRTYDRPHTPDCSRCEPVRAAFEAGWRTALLARAVYVRQAAG